ncbi:MAG: hypothetical protein HY673_00430 [Chloroflexi bacterium]|nr:hypothetical protein [Chloroflexota bacterium]
MTVPVLNVQLSANNSDSASIRAGEPLILTVSLVNASAITGEAANLELRQAREEMERRLAEGQITEKEFKKRSSQLKEERVEKVAVGSSTKPWYEGIAFYGMEDSARIKLQWPLRVLEYPSPQDVVELDEGRAATADYGCDPDLLPRSGEYQIMATVDAPGNIVESNAVKVVFPGGEGDRLESESWLASRASIYLRLGAWDEVKKHIGRLESLDPGSLSVSYLKGEYEEAKGNIDEAIAAYQKALEIFYQQYPNIGEYPELLTTKMGFLAEKRAAGNSSPDKE